MERSWLLKFPGYNLVAKGHYTATPDFTVVEMGPAQGENWDTDELKHNLIYKLTWKSLFLFV